MSSPRTDIGLPGFDRLHSDASIVADEPSGGGRGQKIARNRGVRGAKKLLAVAAALRVSRTLEPRIGGKRKAQEDFLVTGKRKSYEDERITWQGKESYNQHQSQQFEWDRERGRDRVDLPTKESVSYSSLSSSSSSSGSNTSTRGYSHVDKHSLSSAEIKLERMQKAALEKAEKVRKLVEEKASKIRKLAEEKANKLRCLADEKVSPLSQTRFFSLFVRLQKHHRYLNRCLLFQR